MIIIVITFLFAGCEVCDEVEDQELKSLMMTAGLTIGERCAAITIYYHHKHNITFSDMKTFLQWVALPSQTQHHIQWYEDFITVSSTTITNTTSRFGDVKTFL